MTPGEQPAGVDLFWLPLGAGGHCVWWNGRIYAWLVAGSGLDAGKIHPPRGGRAPGWDAGPVVAQRG